MKKHSRSPIIKAPALQIERIEESSLCRQPMSDRRWQKNLALLKTRIGLLDRSLIQEVNGAICAAHEWLEPLMERYCESTCPACRDVCCQATEVYFNLADLLAMLAQGIDPPSGQTRRRTGEPCRYLTQAGCSLTRPVRPYVCVWFLCEAQMDLYREEPASTQRRFVATLEALRTNRLKLESHYESLFPPPLC